MVSDFRFPFLRFLYTWKAVEAAANGMKKMSASLLLADGYTESSSSLSNAFLGRQDFPTSSRTHRDSLPFMYSAVQEGGLVIKVTLRKN